MARSWLLFFWGVGGLRKIDVNRFCGVYGRGAATPSLMTDACTHGSGRGRLKPHHVPRPPPRGRPITGREPLTTASHRKGGGRGDARAAKCCRNMAAASDKAPGQSLHRPMQHNLQPPTNKPTNQSSETNAFTVLRLARSQ